MSCKSFIYNGLSFETYEELESYIKNQVITGKISPKEVEEILNKYYKLPEILPDTENIVRNYDSNNKTINIYAGTNENAHLSNFAIRPFVLDNNKFQSVEQYFQYKKSFYVKDNLSNEDFEHNYKIIQAIMNTTNGGILKRLGRQLKGLDVKRWNENAEKEMKKALISSFEQNPNALKTLLDTGDAILTHNQDNGIWKTKFPKLLMEVREMFKNNPNNKRNTEEKTNHNVEVVDRYSNELVQNNPDKVFVFGDNTLRKGKGGQAIIRDNSNAVSIATKKKPSNSEDSFFNDSEFEENKRIIDADIQKLKEVSNGKTIVFPKNGLGTGLAKLKEKAPKTYEYLKQRLLEEFGFNNDIGEIETEEQKQKALTEEEIIDTLLNDWQKERLRKLKEKYPEIKVEFTQQEGVSFKIGDRTVFNQKVPNKKRFEDIERLSNMIINKILLKEGRFYKKNNSVARNKIFYKSDALIREDAERDIVASVFKYFTSLKELDEKTDSEIIKFLNDKIEKLEKYKNDLIAGKRNKLNELYNHKYLIESFSKKKSLDEIKQYSQEKQEIIRKYMPVLFRDNKYKSEKQAIFHQSKLALNKIKREIEAINNNKQALGINSIIKKVKVSRDFVELIPNWRELLKKRVENEYERRLEYKRRSLEKDPKLKRTILLRDLLKENTISNQNLKLDKNYKFLTYHKKKIKSIFKDFDSSKEIMSSTTSVEVLETIANSDSKYKDLAKSLIDFAKKNNVKIVVVDSIELGVSGRYTFYSEIIKDSKREKTNSLVKDQIILLDGNSKMFAINPERLVLHEIVHSLSSILIVKDHRENGDNSIYYQYLDYIKKKSTELSDNDLFYLNFNIIYGFKNPHELFSEAMTNPDFRNLLSLIPPMKEKEYKNLLDELIDKIKELISKLFKKETYKNALEQLEDLIYTTFEAQSNLALKLEQVLDKLDESIRKEVFYQKRNNEETTEAGFKVKNKTIFNQKINSNNKNSEEVNTDNNTFKELSEDVIKNLPDNQKKLFKKINILADKISKSLGIKIVYTYDSSLNFKGKLNTKNKTVVINLAHATLDTPIHELLGHPLVAYIKKENKKLFENLVDELKNSEEGLEILNKVKELYPKLSEEEQFEEAIVELISLKSANKIHSNKLKTLVNKVIDFIKKFINKLFPVKKGFELSDNMSLKEISNLIDNYVKELDDKISLQIRDIVKEVLNYDLGEPISQETSNKETYNQKASNQNINNGWSPKQVEKKYKKAFGETAYRLIRDTASGLLIEPEKALTWLKEKIPIKSHAAFVIKEAGIYLEKEYLEYLSGSNESEYRTEIQDPFELIKKAGYEVTEIQEPKDALNFKSYYGEGEVLCTYRDVEGRLSKNIILWIKRPNAENILPADKLTQDNLSPEWKEYLEKKGRKNPDGSYNLKGLLKESGDPYGRSVVSIQINRKNGYLKEINRYNHMLDKGSVDNTFNKNLNNLIKGLHDSLYEKYDIAKPDYIPDRNIDNLIQDAKGKYYYYLNEKNGYYYSPEGYLHNGEYKTIDKNTQRIIGGYLFDTKTKEFRPLWENKGIENISNIKFTKSSVTVEFTDKTYLTLRHDQYGNVLEIASDLENFPLDTSFPDYSKVEKLSLPNVKKIEDGFLFYNSELESISLPKVEEIGNKFLSYNQKLESIYLPNVRKIGNSFLGDNIELKILSLPKVKEIGNEFLEFNRKLESISLPNVEEIRNQFLYYNIKLEKLSLPNVKKIGDNFLITNKELKSISLPNVKEIGSWFLYYNQKLESISLPNVKEIGSWFLYYNEGLKSISLPNVEKIGNSFLYYNKELETISLPNVKEIGEEFLKHNEVLKTISLPNVKEIGKEFLGYNEVLKSISLPNVEKIGDDFLMINKELKSISLPNVEKIGDYFLRLNQKLESVSLPNVKKIGDYFLYRNEKFKNLSSQLIKENNNQKTNLSESSNNTFNQKIGEEIAGQADIKALKVLLDAEKINDTTIDHEFAHFYIEWNKNTEIVKEALKKWATKGKELNYDENGNIIEDENYVEAVENLVQAIAEQAVKQKGEAWNWWKKFLNWINEGLSKLRKLDKETLKNIITDAYLNRENLQDLNEKLLAKEKSKATKPTLEDIVEWSGNKTQSENVKIVPTKEIFDTAKEQAKTGSKDKIIAFRVDKNKSFLQNFLDSNAIGNPFSAKEYGEKKATEMFLEWLTTDKYDKEFPKLQEYKQALVKAFKSEQLKEKQILYYEELNRPSYATVIDYLANEYAWDKQTEESISKNNIEEPTNSKQPVVKEKNTGPFFVEVNGKKIETEFELSNDQKQALQDLADYVDNNQTAPITLQGQAGTGKTTIISYLEKYLGTNILYLAPTHAATLNLSKSIQKNNPNKMAFTLRSSIFKRYKRNGRDIVRKNGVPVWNPAISNKAKNAISISKPVIVVDEASMVDPEYYEILEKFSQQGYKVIFLGDMKQLPYVVVKNIKSKKLSLPFIKNKVINLKKVHRAKDQNLIDLLDKIWHSTDKLYKTNKNTSNIKFYESPILFENAFYKKLKEAKENETVMYITYTNKKVQAINKNVREYFGKPEHIVKGDKIVGYIGKQSKQLHLGNLANSVVYNVVDINMLDEEGKPAEIVFYSEDVNKILGKNDKTTGKTKYYQLSGNDSIKIEGLSQNDFEENNKYISSLFKKLYLTTLIPFSLKKLNYFTYKERIDAFNVMFSSIDLGNNYIYNPTTERMEIFDRNNKTQTEIKKKYPDLYIEKGADYGYAITIHKSQGSTYDYTFVDGDSFKNVPSIDILDKDGNVITTERQAAGYVAMSRGRYELHTFEGETYFEPIEGEEEKEEETPQQQELPDFLKDSLKVTYKGTELYVKDCCIYDNAGNKIFEKESQDRNKVIMKAKYKYGMAFIENLNNEKYIADIFGNIMEVSTGNMLNTNSEKYEIIRAAISEKVINVLFSDNELDITMFYKC